MRCRPFVTVAFLLAIPAVASAQSAGAPTTLSSLAVGNTMEVDYPNVPGHPHVTFKLKADGTFTAVFPGGVAGGGDYVTDSRYLCWIAKGLGEPSANGDNARCEVNTAAGKTLGESWTMTDSMGAEAVITIHHGQ